MKRDPERFRFTRGLQIYSLLAFCACISVQTDQPTKADDRPNILLIVGEDHGCELSCYGDPVIDTPNIDQLAAGGMLFEMLGTTTTVCCVWMRASGNCSSN